MLAVLEHLQALAVSDADDALSGEFFDDDDASFESSVDAT